DESGENARHRGPRGQHRDGQGRGPVDPHRPAARLPDVRREGAGRRKNLFRSRQGQDLPRYPRSLNYFEGAPRLRLMHRAASAHSWTETNERGFVMAKTKKASKGKKKSSAKKKTGAKKKKKKMAKAR